jgi:hypothetical protein
MSELGILMGAVGTETTADSTGKPYFYQPSGAKSGAADQNGLAEVAELIALWPHLPALVRSALLQLARSARE